MKKVMSIITILVFLTINSKSQITKKNWMVGGNARVSSQNENINGASVKGFDFTMSPSIGYFFVDKFAGGVKASLNYSKVKFNGGVSKSTQDGIGPFLRYYFLNPNYRVNLLTETAYQIIFSKNNVVNKTETSNVFTFSAGPVIYFNTVVGIEALLNYEIFNNNGQSTKAKTFYLNIGFQIHLKKDDY